MEKIDNLIEGYPALAPLYNAKDPRILMQLEAQATMLAMLSAQIETAQTEVFEKVRNATVLADAAMRGIVRKASPTRVRILAKNENSSPFYISTDENRFILDSNGNYYLIVSAATISAGGTATFEALQVKTDTITHTVSGSHPFYAIEIPDSDDGSFLSGIAVKDADGEFEYRERYVNTWVNERVYHVEADDRQRVYVRFGQSDVVGTQPADGTVITLEISRTIGNVSPIAGSPFSFETITDISESSVKLTMDAVLEAGKNPLDISALRDLARYPSVYDHNAVYLGEFDFLVRVNFPDVQFLSVWNESVEEIARVPSRDNINCLFIAVLSATGNETTLTGTEEVQDHPELPWQPVQPEVIAENNYTATQTAIKNAIKRADDSYRVRFLTPVISKIAVTVIAEVSTAYVAADVLAKIREVLLQEYGAAAANSKRGSNQPLYREVYALLKVKIPALSDGRADLQVTIAQPIGSVRPELWRYIADDSLTVTVNTANINLPSWGGRL